MDHDQLLKSALTDRFADIVRLFLPGWADRFDFDAVEWMPTEAFPDPPRGERRTLDLAARLPVGVPANPTAAATPGPWLVLVHVEIESADTTALLRGRVFDYYLSLWQRHRLPVLPIGLFMDVGRGGIEWDEVAHEFFGERVAAVRYLSVGLPALDAEPYLRSGLPLGAALAALMRVPPDRRAEFKIEAMDRIAAGPASEYSKHLLLECVEAYLKLEGEQLAHYNELTDQSREGAALTYEQRVKRLFEEKLQEGRRDALRLLMSGRGSELTVELNKRIDQLSGDELTEAILSLGRGQLPKNLGIDEVG